MITEDFTGYGARMEVDLGQRIEGESLQARLIEFMSRISMDCVEEGVKLIGHIKSITDIPDGGYLACSVTNHEGRVRTDGELNGGSSFEMILNVMIYGLEMDVVERIVDRRAREYFEVDGATMKLEILEGEDDHDHDHDHEHSESNVSINT